MSAFSRSSSRSGHHQQQQQHKDDAFSTPVRGIAAPSSPPSPPPSSRAFGGVTSRRTSAASPTARQSQPRGHRKSFWDSTLGGLRRTSAGGSSFMNRGPHSQQQNDRFPRSYTAAVDQPAEASFPPWTGNRSAKALSFHPGYSGPQHFRRGSNADLERSAAWNRNAGSESAFEASRYHRMTYQSDAPSDEPVAASYTATSDSIRDSTAKLAGMAVMSDDDHSAANDSRIEEEEEDVDGAVTIGRRTWLPSPEQSQDTPTGPISRSYGSTGPSNLAKALETSSSVSPVDSRTLRAVEAPSQSEPDERTSLLRRGRSPVPRAVDATQDEITGDRAALDSAFSAISSQGGQNHPRSVYGTGALAQASWEAEAGGAARTDDPYGGLDAENEDVIIDSRGQPGPGDDDALQPRWSATSRWRDWQSARAEQLRNAKSTVRKLSWQDVLNATAEPIRLFPATVLGVLMNILDGVSYGLIIFPSYPVFADMGSETGVSLFFLSCVIAQVTYTLGGSIFKGGNGSMMIEVVPFYHIVCSIIIDSVGEDNPRAVISTTMVAFALSSIFTGLAFLLLGLCKLGVLIGFFPRHILVGCIGGVGVFLLETGFEVAGRLEGDKGFKYNYETLAYLFQSWHVIALWGTPLLLAVLLRVIMIKVHHPLVMPTYFIAITPIFYLIAVGILGKSVPQLQSTGWIFDIGPAGKAPFYRYLGYFDFTQTSWEALWKTMPTMVSLTFFSILHVPLNVPALAVSLKEDNVNVDRELTGHGISNLIAGALGTVPNYLCFSNTLLFYRVGGGSRLSGLLLAAATAVILIMGPGLINYLNVSTVGALIFLLGIDLCKEAVWDTIGTVNNWEYLTIWFIIVVMSLADFVIGILAGICLACLFLTIQMSRRKTVRACFDGSVARSTVRRPMTQRKFLESVGTQTQILKLQGFLFFATINSVEALIRRALDIAAWQQKPMRFLVIDLSLVSGLDFSAAEAFTRVYRLLQRKDVLLVFCGLPADGEVGRALRSVGLWADCGLNIEAFPSLNEALEWTENSYIRGMYTSELTAGRQFKQASLGAHGALSVPDAKRAPAFVLDEAYENSPRRHHLHEAAKKAVTRGASAFNGERLRSLSPGDADVERTVGGSDGQVRRKRRASSLAMPRAEQPLPLLAVTFGAYATGEMDEAFFTRLCKYLKRVELLRDEQLWNLGDEPDGLYLIESGALKAKYDFESKNFEINEAMLAGTVAGELSFLCGQARDTSAKAELNSVLWKLDHESMSRLEKEEPEMFSLFVKLLLRVAVDEQSSVMSYLVSRLS
ncbi:unnamed protein product [Parajaminaea phylloscopi]